MFEPEIPALYEIAKSMCHEFGMDYFDPRTGKKYPAPKKENPKKRKKARRQKK
jgi:hypothetical protein